MFLLFNLELKELIIRVLSHQIQKDWAITRSKQMIVNHATIHIELVKECTGDNGTGESESVSVKMDAFSSCNRTKNEMFL